MPRYHFPWDLFLGLVRDLPARRRSFVDDCAAMASRIAPPAILEGMDCIPPRGGIVLAANHYQRPGLWIGWPGAVITATVAEARGGQTLHWLATGGLRLFQWRGTGPEIPLTRAIFGAVAQTYGMAALPLSSGGARSAAIRTWLRWLAAGEPIGIFPEGLRGRSDGLRHPEPGFDTLCRLLRRQGAMLLPCGVSETGDQLRIRFGQPSLFPDGADRVMQDIASLLPSDIRGVYQDVQIAPVGAQAVSGGSLD